jgi:drug/metabolite transporter (DMT)-like permease
MTLSPTWARNHHTLATLSLVAITAVWGGTFVVVQDAVERMPVLPFLFWRFLLAFAVLALLRPRAVLGLSAEKRWHGLLLGLMLGAGYVLQTFGLLHTSATVSGFITGMFVVFTPLIGWVVLAEPVGRAVWVGVALATLGLALISLNGLSLGFGELLTLGCAAMFAGQIVGLARWSTASDAYGLTVLQLGVVALMCLVASPLEGGMALPPDAGVWAAVVFLAVAATALAFLGQTWALTHMTAPRAAIVLTLEPVFAGIFGVTVGGDQLTARIVAGGACIVAAMYVVELGPRIRQPAGR